MKEKDKIYLISIIQALMILYLLCSCMYKSMRIKELKKEHDKLMQEFIDVTYPGNIDENDL